MVDTRLAKRPNSVTEVGLVERKPRPLVSHVTNVSEVGPAAKSVQMAQARAALAIAKTKYVEPIRVFMRYILAAIMIALVFMLGIALITKWLGLDSTLSIAIVVATGTIMAPVGFVAIKLAGKFASASPAELPTGPDA